MKLLCWNVNSIRARFERLAKVLERHSPDVVCLQETKVTDDIFPAAELKDAGYEAAFHGQKTYNGVAILSKKKLEDVAKGFGDGNDEAQARLVGATVGGTKILCAYAPNGQAVGTDKYEYKLSWFKRLRKYLDSLGAADATPLVLCGDFNVAPEDKDVHDPKLWEEQVLCSTKERKALQSVAAYGLTDTFRHLYPEKVQYTWWDYRQLGFPKNRGLRIDHIFVTKPLVAKIEDVLVDRDERKGQGASDHAPVIAVFK